MTRKRDKQGRFLPSWEEPDPGPLWIECDLTSLGPTNCRVVDMRQPLPDLLNEGGKGFVSLFEGSFTECRAWITQREAEAA